MSRRSKITSELVREWKALRNQGYSYNDIVDKYQGKYSLFSIYSRTNDVEYYEKTHKLSPLWVTQMSALYQNTKYSVSQIAEKCGVAPAHVYYYVKKLNLSRKTKSAELKKIY